MTTVTIAILAEILWVGGLATWIVLDRRSPTATLAWIFALAWLPFLGAGVYLLIGPRRLHRKKRRYAAARVRAAEAAGAAGNHAADAPPKPLLAISQGAGYFPALRAERIEVYHCGDDCYQNLYQAIEDARRHIHLEYYIFAPDATGTQLRDLLCKKARQGVQVRLLLDAIGSSSTGRRFLAPLEDAGADVAWFNPISLARLRPGLMNFRTHRKIVVCDGRVGFIGGINICNEQSAAACGDRAWRDSHLRIEGAPVRWLQCVFLEDWYFATGGGPSSREYFPEPVAQPQGPWVEIVASGPDHDAYPIHKYFFAAITGAQRRAYLTTPYFVPDEAILAALTTTALRRVDVRVLVPKQSDSRLVTAAARSYFEELIRAGVKVYEYQGKMLHAKTLAIDDRLSIVGSANMDNRSFRLNFEVIAAIHDPATAAEMTATFCSDIRRARPYSIRRARQTRFPQRLAQGTARLLSPLL